MSDIDKRITEAITLGLAPGLKADGFRKSGKTFHREVPTGIQVLNAQSSRHNRADEGTFTLNLGMYYPAVARRLQQTQPRGLPSESQCTLRRRIGSLLPAGQDHWWTVTAQSDLRQVADELAAAWATYAQPWFARVVDAQEGAEELERTRMLPAAAAMRLELGQRAEAERIWRAALAGPPAQADLARWWGETLGFQA